MPKPVIRKPQFLAELDETTKASSILQYAHDSAESFVDAFRTVRKDRQAGRGRPTDEEHDLLRAMLVISAAGLDSMLKQLIRDALPRMLKITPSLLESLVKFVTSQIRSDVEEKDPSSGKRFLANLLCSESIYERVIEEYVHSLTGSSLQSADELLKICAVLGLERDVLDGSVGEIKGVFYARNEIIHEMDIDFGVGIRNRRPRSLKAMVDSSNRLLQTGENILKAVEMRIRVSER